MSDTVIRVEHLGKQYRIGTQALAIPHAARVA